MGSLILRGVQKKPLPRDEPGKLVSANMGKRLYFKMAKNNKRTCFTFYVLRYSPKGCVYYYFPVSTAAFATVQCTLPTRAWDISYCLLSSESEVKLKRRLPSYSNHLLCLIDLLRSTLHSTACFAACFHCLDLLPIEPKWTCRNQGAREKKEKNKLGQSKSIMLLMMNA